MALYPSWELPFVLYRYTSRGHFIFTWMISRKSDSGKTSALRGEIPWMSHAIFGLVCALVIVLFVWSAQSGFLESANLHAEDSYYNRLVQGFSAGQLNMKLEAPPGLAQLADPYDPAVNTAYIRDVGDISYYRGKLYLYFGVTPALALFWPYATLTSHYLLDTAAVVIFFTLGFLVAAGLLQALWRRYFPEASIWTTTAGILTMGLATGILADLSRCDVYSVAYSCGFAFTMLALAAIWCALHEPKRQVMWLLLASLAYGLAIGSRPPLLFGGIILLLPVAQAWRAATEPSSRRRVGWLLAAAVGPVMLIGLGLMLYNFLRFDSPFEFGSHYQLNGKYQPTTARLFSLHYFWFNFRFYFLEPMRWSGHFPFLRAAPLSPLPAGYCEVTDPFGGMLSNYPLVWLALAVPLAWRGRSLKVVSGLRWFTAAVFLIFALCALPLCLFFAAASRYVLDFLPALMLLAVIGILGLERALAGSPVWRRIARCGWCLLLAYTVGFNLLASVEAHALANCFAGDTLLAQGRADKAIEHYRRALALWPAFTTSRCHLGNALSQKGLGDEAIIQYQEALKIEPDSAEVHNNLGCALFQKGREEDAIVQFQMALKINPDSADTHYNLGCLLFQKGRANEVITHFQKAFEIRPRYAEAHNALGDCLLQIGRVDEAIEHYQKAVELQPRSAVAYNGLGCAFRRKAMAVSAVACFQKAIELQPQFITAQIDLAWMLATWPDPPVRNGDRAVTLAGQANQLSKDNDPLILRTLAAAYAEAGRFPEAVVTAKQALALAQSSTGLASVLQAEIGLYQTNSPCRSTSSYFP